MKELYFKLVVSTADTIKNSGNFNKEWKVMAFMIMSLLFMLNLLSIWLIADKLFPGFTSFLAFDVGWSYRNTVLLYIFCYFLLPFLILNYLFAFRSNKYELLYESYPKARNKKLFAIHFIGSFVLGLLCFFTNIFI